MASTWAQSWTCGRCGAAISARRRDVHESTWCPAIESTSKRVPAAVHIAAPSIGFATAPAHASTAKVKLSSGLHLSFQQQSVFGELSTGGAIWRSELVLAEWCATVIPRIAAARELPPLVVELGCGVAPAAGLQALALGASVLFTDLSTVLPFTEANLRLNSSAVSALRTSNARSEVSRSCCDTAALCFGSDALPDRLVSLASAQRGIDVVIVSDCIFRAALHAPLARSLRAVLDCDTRARKGVGAPTCVVAFRLRDDADMRFFDRALPSVGLVAAPLSEVDALTKLVPRRDVGRGGEAEQVFLYSVARSRSF